MKGEINKKMIFYKDIISSMENKARHTNSHFVYLEHLLAAILDEVNSFGILDMDDLIDDLNDYIKANHSAENNAESDDEKLAYSQELRIILRYFNDLYDENECASAGLTWARVLILLHFAITNLIKNGKKYGGSFAWLDQSVAYQITSNLIANYKNELYNAELEEMSDGNLNIDSLLDVIAEGNDIEDSADEDDTGDESSDNSNVPDPVRLLNAIFNGKAKIIKRPMPELGDQQQRPHDYQHQEKRQSAIEFFGDNLSEKPRRMPLINREAELNRLIEVLLRKDKPNPIILGSQGVGKTAIVQELAIRIKEGNVPLTLRQQVRAIYSLDMTKIIAGSHFRGDFENRLHAILEEAKTLNGQVILFFDELHTIMNAGASSGDSMNASNILKPYLSDGSIRLIGATTTDEYRRYVESDGAFKRRFMTVNVDEPSIESTIQIISGIKERYEAHHGVRYTDEAIRAAVELSAAHIHDRYLPDKAIDLIDEAGAKSSATIYADADRDERYIQPSDIEEVLYDTYKIPRSVVNIDEASMIRDLENSLRSQVFGQDSAIQALVKRVKLAAAGIRDKNKPIANILFVGPTGTGKTEISKALAQSLGKSLQRFDMSEYSEEASVSKLFGSSAGYVGYDDGGILTNAIRTSPNSVILFDEIEKAHSKVYNTLLQIMDYGFMTDNKGTKVDFRNTIIIMTSNAGASQIVKKNLGFGKASESMDNGAVDNALKDTFSPEFRARLTDIIIFNDLSPEIAQRIASKELDILAETLSSRGIYLKTTKRVIEHIAEAGYSPMVGARNIKNLVTEVSYLLADDMIFGGLVNGGEVKIDWNGTVYTKRITKRRATA